MTAKVLNQAEIRRLVHLNVPLARLLESLDVLIVVHSLRFADTLKHILNTGHHSLKTAEVHVGAVSQLIENLVSILLNLILDVHLSTLLVLLFTGEGVVKSEVIGVTRLGILELIIVKEGVAVGNAEEEPGLALVYVSDGSVLEEETTDEATEGGNSGSGGNHDVIGGRVGLGHKHDLTCGSGHHDITSGGGVAKEVRADALLGRIVGLEFGAPVRGATDAETAGLARHIIAVTRGGDGVQTDGVGLAVLLAGARGDDTPGLALDVGEVTVVVHNDVARLASGLGPDNTLGRHDLSGEGGLVFVGVDLDLRVVVVRGVLKEVLLQVEGGSVTNGRYKDM